MCRTIYYLYLLFFFGTLSDDTRADEEVPVPHSSATETSNKKLQDILDRLSSQTAPASVSSGSCRHEQLEFTVPLEQVDRFQNTTRTLVKLANLLNTIYLSVPHTENIRHKSSREIYYPPSGLIETIVKNALDVEPDILSLGVAFVKTTQQNASHAGVLAWRNHGKIIAGDIAKIYGNNYDYNQHSGTRWFTEILYRSNRRTITPSSEDLTSPEDGYWELSPTLDCGASNQWVLSHSLPFFERNGTESAFLKGVILSNHPLQAVDINQCDVSQDLSQAPPFSGTHKCPSSTQCQSVVGSGFVRGGYICHCKQSFYLPNSSVQFFLGGKMENYEYSDAQCIPCPEGCPNCGLTVGAIDCVTKRYHLLRSIPIRLQVIALILTVIFAFIIIRRRKSPIISSSMWTMLLSIMMGAILIYSTVLVRGMEASVLSCVGEQWLRETGFILYYGAIILKLYRSLVQHRTRRAHRIVIRDLDLLKYLAGLLTFVVGYLGAGSAMAIQMSSEGKPLLTEGITGTGHTFKVCQVLWWEYVTEGGEICFLFFGVYLACQLRGASGRFIASLGGRCNLSEEYKASAVERRALTASLFLELLFSFLLYTARHIHILVTTIHPDHVFLAYFLRTHVTVTISMLMIIAPKICCNRNGQDSFTDSQNTGEGSTEVHLCEQLANGDVEINDINISQMDPEEIRGEMRRVYTQLEELRAKTITKDNPHISKRRGGRKPTHRRFSLTNRKGSKDKSVHKHRGGNTMDCLEVDNRTPEDSVCSIEAPSAMSLYGDGPSNFSDATVQISCK